MPHRTFVDNSRCTAFHLIRDPDLKTLDVGEASTLFGLPDLVGSLSDYVQCIRQGMETFRIGGRRAGSSSSNLPFTRIRVWSKVVLQGKQYYSPDLVTNPETIYAMPPGGQWVYGRNDCAVVNIDPNHHWPQSSIQGES